MATVSDLIKELSKFPGDYVCWVYEEGTEGIAISKDGETIDETGHIEFSSDEDCKTTFNRVKG